jgi:Fur family peroxide stress response transcriptional regulator
MSDSRTAALDSFRQRCREDGLAFTFQRQVIYEAVIDSREHPTPELIYEQVRQRIPSISLGTVYKNLKTLLDLGLLREVTIHHGTLRVESNLTPHHHLVCSSCKAIFDIEESAVGGLEVPKTQLPAGFSIKQCRVEFIGLCKSCQSARPEDVK